MNEHYAIFPKVVPIDKDVQISISGVHDRTIIPEKEYNVRVQAMCNHYDSTQYKINSLSIKPKFEDSELSKGGTISFNHKFRTKGEHTIIVTRDDNSHLTTEQIYVVSQELADLKPYRGDLHIHTYYSDGSMSPIFMAIMAKKLGYDFAAITDHRKYFPSLEAIEMAKKINLDLLLFPGEEIDFGTAHIVSVCANASVVEARGDEESYKKQLRETVDNRLKDAIMVENLTKDQYAPAKWTIDKIHEFNGYAFLAHPYWVSGNRYDHHLPLFDQLLKDKEIDGVEVIGGHWQFQYESNMLAMVRYYQEVANGHKIPILGNSDTHYNYKIGKDLFGWYWTTVFAKSLTKEDIFSAILNLKSVACERPYGERFVACGPYDLVEYTCFLDREFFPLHDRICSMMADIYFDILADKDVEIDQLNKLRKNLDELYKLSWAGNN